ncbi:MAG: hypothetical protein GY950_36030, partial [bacterium]|nr:hypothetical protein [bacterium]
MIEKKIIQLNAEDFAVGAIRTWKNFLFVFDVTKAEMLQLSPSYEVILRIPLTGGTGIKQIDTVFFTEETLVAADSLSKKFYRWSPRLEPDKTVSISGCTEYPLPPGSIITAAASRDDNFYLLDKGNSMIRVCDREFRELKTIGSRMGYMYEEERRQRLGFEFPEDMVISEDRFLVSDSGNKRLVVIDGEGKQENVIKLPEFPYKFISCDRDRVVLSDFDRSVMMVSLKYGFICLEELDYPVDFFPAYCAAGRGLVGSEHSTKDKNELVELKMQETSVLHLAKESGNMEVLMKLKIDDRRVEEAREIVLAHPELLPEYASYTVDHAVENRLADYVSEAVKAVPALNKTLREDILRLSVEFIKKYKAIPNSDD